MYRTEQWYEEVKNNKLKTPICIMSYKRPDAPIFSNKCSLWKDTKKNEVFLFIRNTEEAYNQYKYLEDRLTIVKLPDYITEAGDTRQAILDWAHNNDYERIFVFDDRIKEVNILAPKTTRNGTQGLAKLQGSTFYDALLVWEKILDEHPFTLSSPAHKGFSWYPEHINAAFEPNNSNCCACICINIDDVFDYDIKYHLVKDTGGDDLMFMIDIMKAGLPLCRITDIEFGEVPSKDLASGGTHSATETLMSKCEKNIAKFLEYYKVDDPVGHPEFSIRKQSGGKYVTLNWRYWKEYYKQHKAKEV